MTDTMTQERQALLGGEMLALAVSEGQSPKLPPMQPKNTGSRLSYHERIANCLRKHGPQTCGQTRHLLGWTEVRISSALHAGLNAGIIGKTGFGRKRIYRAMKIKVSAK